MKRSVSSGLGVLSLAFVLGCGGGAELSWQEFRALVYQEPDTCFYVANGDELFETDAELRALYDDVANSAAYARAGLGALSRPSIVNRVNGKDDVWSSSQAQNLTYCISQSSFGSRYNAMVSAMSKAAGAWEAAGRINFVHDAAQDGKCSKNTNVVFNIRQVCTGRYLARAFFPSTSRAGREILVDCTSFGNISPWTLEGVMRHELGHTIGLRHEHTRPESGTCFEDNSWRALSTYDSASVMHYPQCNGSNGGDLNLTTKDKAGAAALYP